MLGFLKFGFAYGQSLNPYVKRDDLNKIYNLLFCDDIGLYKKGFTGKQEYPWNILFSEKPDKTDLAKVQNDPKLESRQHLLASGLRKTKEAGEPVMLYGIVIEVGLKEGLDVLASFKDGSARYINHSGKLIVWETEDEEVSRITEGLFKAGNEAIQKIGPWGKARLPAPKTDNLRITFLTSNGIYFGEGPIGLISSDAVGGPVVQKGTELMVDLIKKASEPAKK